MSFDILKKVDAYSGIFDSFPKRTPSNGEPDGALLGNGDIGVTTGGKSDELTFWLSKNDFWCAAPNHAYRGGLKCIGTLKICSEALIGAAFSAKQAIADADVIVDLKNNDCHLHVSAYTPYHRNLVIIQAKSEKGEIPLQISIGTEADELAVDSCENKDGDLVITKEYCKKPVSFESKVAVCCHVIEWGKPKGILQEGEVITIILAIATNFDSLDYLAHAKKNIADCTSDSLRVYRGEHLKWWHDFWTSSGISIPSEPEVEKFWYGSHYLMASCSKAGKFAPGIFGNWITTNTPNWGGDYHLNYNYQAPWWGVFSSNKVALSEPYDQPLFDYIPTAQKHAQNLLGCRGIYSKVGIGPKAAEISAILKDDGSQNNVFPFWGQKSNAAYASVNMLMRFYSTYDLRYAEKCAYPYLLEVADFWEDYLKFENGRYVIYNDCIHENPAAGIDVYEPRNEKVPDYSNDFNPILTIGLLRVVFKGLLDIDELLRVHPERKEKWAHILAHLSEFPLQRRMGRKVFRYTESGMKWCNGNSLGIQHIYPCGTIGLSSDEKTLKVARNTVRIMHRWTDYNAFPTFFTAAVRVGYNPNTILKKMKKQFKLHSFPNLFIYYGGGGIECCSAVPSCINEMLFQSHEGILRFFPVWNGKKDAEFHNLRGYGAFVVSAMIQGGEVGEITLLSEKGRTCSVLSPWAKGMEVFSDGKAILTDVIKSKDGSVYTFDTKENTIYIFHPLM